MALLPTDSGAVQREWKPRLTWASGALVLVFLTLLTRLYQLQILHGDEYREKAEENFVKELRLPADRGQLLDRRGKVLVDSRPSFDVTLTPYFCAKQCGEVLDRLTTLLAMAPEEVERARAACWRRPASWSASAPSPSRWTCGARSWTSSRRPAPTCPGSTCSRCRTGATASGRWAATSSAT